ncbi:P-loop containing nucleoside triphosphate hydrolase protein [Papiliotrema laurentii]|uniref:Kinesin-like protein n=1 Tax=Papiliotrema laurentii TaxID=5418 RepID=A0AAD9FQE1_PAPLA|nr:P-loop containing nucleoside triphosphate hydrolase protein [Papiliotrema laurentii]
MEELQDQQPPATSRLPLPSTRASASAIPLSTSINANKRKVPSSPAIPVAKRQVSGSSLSESTSTARKPSAGFRPTTTRKPSTTLSRPTSTSSTLTRSTAARSSNGSVGSSSSTTTTRTRPTTAAARPLAASRTRPPVSSVAAGTRSAGTLARSVGPGRGVSPSLGRGVGAGMGVSAIGSGMASAARVKTQDGRIENVESKLSQLMEMMKQEQMKISNQQLSQEDIRKLLSEVTDTEREKRRELSNASEEIAALSAKYMREIEDLEGQIRRKDREKRNLEEELKESRDELSRERETIRELKRTLAEQSTQHLTINAQLAASQAQQTALQAEVERATLNVSAMRAELDVGRKAAREAEDRAEERARAAEAEADRRIAEIEEELRTAETIRRKLHNQVQELKGNIRVFARIRPALPHESSDPEALADIAFSDERTDQETGQSQIVVTSRSESATGREREQVNNFTFDKVFQPKVNQAGVFEEISMLAQSVLDGYNVCVFAYGQTGSGKSWTMEGGQTEETMGMIPRAIDMIFTVSKQLEDRGWKYQMEGQFLEVYNEVINDLLGSGQFDTKKHEIKLDKDGKMSVTDVISVPLSNSRQVSTLLEKARSRRAVAATLMNERSSRSHSVFTLKVKGFNPLTDEKCEAMLNLVDLAGSERLDSSGAGANKDRLKETININKSLSALADVIGALGQGQQGGHVPYRNSTLTRLLQTSLSGSSKTLMLCNVSPLAAHLGETLCSLRFATKVNSTVVGKAQKNK